MKNNIKKVYVGLLILFAMMINLKANAINLWVGQSYTWDFSGSIMGSTYNMSVTTSGGYLSVTGSGFYRTITPTQYFSGTATVTAEWDYTLYYGDTKKHQRVSVSISCNENPVSISPTSVTLTPGETYQLGYSHAYTNQYVSAANAYFSGGNSSFSVTSGGLITAKSPGTGYVNVYSKVSSAANAPYCYVTVKEIEPTGATTGNYSVMADQSTDLTVNVSPSNASVKTKQWYVKSGSDVVSISGSKLTGLKPGTATIYCMINGSIRSNDATVTVNEPKLTVSQMLPTEGSTDISVFAVPSVTYSHSISKGSDFNSISLTSNGNKIDGTTEISGSRVRFIPSKPLQPLAKHTLYIPKSAVNNKWGSSAQSDVSMTFTTADLETAIVEFTPKSGSHITSAEAVKLSATPSDAKIYYTIDGSEPTQASALYDEPIAIPYDMTIKAIAIREGYKDSDIAIGNFQKSQSEILEYYPSDNSPMYNYSYANPYITLSGAMVKSNNFRRISLKKSSGDNVEGNAYLADHVIVFVPDNPLENVTTYTLDIPYDAIKTENGEVFKGFSWSFTTPNMPVKVGISGDESVFLLSENGQLLSQGMQVKSSKPSGEIEYENWNTLTSYAAGISDLSCGYFHHAILNDDIALIKGLNYCGELGDGKFSYSSPIAAMKAGFQTTAIICEDHTLWMSGRNDFNQLCVNDGTHSTKFIKAADNVIDVALGNGYTLYVDTDNTLWGVGRNHMGQLGDSTAIDRFVPVKIMDGVEKVFASASGYFSACITVDNDLYTWGDNSLSRLGREAISDAAVPKKILSDISLTTLGEAHGLALTTDHKLYCWGSNAFGQIDEYENEIAQPKLMDENVLHIDAGPNTSMILYLSGKATGWGRKTHSNFGDGFGIAYNYVLNEGVEYSLLQGASLVPRRFEIEPNSDFAFSPVPMPLSADYESVEWFSSNPEIAAVDGNGIVHAENLGETTITVKFVDRYGNTKEANAEVICTNTPNNSGIDAVMADNSCWSAYSVGKKIIVKNPVLGATYTVYNTQGVMVAQSEATSQMLSFDVYNTGVYIVQCGSTVVKVLCQ